MISPCIMSFAIATLADLVLRAYGHPSSTWSINHDVSQLQVRQHWGGRVDGSAIDAMKRGLYRRGGSNGTGIGKFSTALYDEQTNGTNTTVNSVLSSLAGGQPLLYSSCSVQGERQYMEDEYFVAQGRFAAVFDGHGGSAISRYLRQNLYANYQAALPTSASKIIEAADAGRLSSEVPTQSSVVASALESAFDKVDSEVGSISHWSFQGSTSLAVVIHENADNGGRSIVCANVGDSRAILSRGRTAVDLTKDHKPNDSAERERIESQGGSVDWCGEVDNRGRPVEHTGVYRINGNLALSRAIGDRSERPWVTNTVDLAHYDIDTNDSFVLLATDGLFDVMSSQEVVSFIHKMVDSAHADERNVIQHDIASYVVEEALRRGTNDNVTVLVVWLNNGD